VPTRCEADPPIPGALRAARRLLPALLSASLLAASGAAAVAPGSAAVRAVVTYDGAVPALPGVRVLESLPTLGALVVEGPASAVAGLPRQRGVRGVAPDVAVSFTGRPGAAPALRAATGLGGAAGRPGAGQGVRIAVVDTGVTDTPGLDRRSGRLVDAVDTSGGPAKGPFVDGYGHGTFMASVIAGGPAEGAKGEPVGVAPSATVLVVRVAQPDGRTRLSQVLGGLEWVAAHADRVDVANLSFSYTRPGTAYGADPLTDAVEAVRDAGITVVVSAGNDPTLVGDPGFTPRALTVGAADLTGGGAVVAPFSGSDTVAGVAKPDVVASGVGVLGVLPASSVLARDNPQARAGGRLWRGSGTSQAAAVTSGAVALLLEQAPDSTPAEVKAALRSAARPLPGERDGAGLLQLAAPGTVPGADEPSAGPGGSDPTGEGGFDANSWSANSWSANSWSANSWSANSWSANSWSANSWSANSWSANSWSANSWSANSWSANSWSANSWSANSWSWAG
jgi:serine protease AprX